MDNLAALFAAKHSICGTTPLTPPAEFSVARGPMQDLYQRVPEKSVTKTFQEMAEQWPTCESASTNLAVQHSKVHFEYDFGSKRVLIAQGCATLASDDGAPPTKIQCIRS